MLDSEIVAAFGWTHKTIRKVTCAGCGNQFSTITTQEEMEQEFIEVFGRKPEPSENRECCDECYQRILKECRK